MFKIEEILHKEELTKEEIIFLLSLEDESDMEKLFERANTVRSLYCGEEVHLRGIIEISNHCEQDCLYCGLRNENYKLQRYRMDFDEIIKTAERIYLSGIKTVVLQSGEDRLLTKNCVTRVIKRIKEDFDLAITLSFGEREFDNYAEWKIAGADRYLLKHETANAEKYPIYHLGQRLEERLENLRFLKSIGFQIGTGNIIGLPKQTIEDIADDILLCKELNADMVSFSPFIPSPETPYRNQRNANINFIFKTIAVARIVLKDVHMPATTALAALIKNGYEKGLMIGANVIMPNFTPLQYHEKYKIYPKERLIKNYQNSLHDIKESILKLGRGISNTKGNSLKKLQTK